MRTIKLNGPPSRKVNAKATNRRRDAPVTMAMSISSLLPYSKRVKLAIPISGSNLRGFFVNGQPLNRGGTTDFQSVPNGTDFLIPPIVA